MSDKPILAREKDGFVTNDPNSPDYIADLYIESLEDKGEVLKGLIVSWRSMFAALNTRSKMRHESNRSLVKFNPLEGQGRVLALLESSEGKTQVELAQELEIKPQTLGAHLKKLEGQELIERKKDATDGRALLVFLTPKGHEALRALRAESEYSGSMFEALTTDEMLQLKTLVEKLDRRLREEIKVSSTAEPFH